MLSRILIASTGLLLWNIPALSVEAAIRTSAEDISFLSALASSQLLSTNISTCLAEKRKSELEQQNERNRLQQVYKDEEEERRKKWVEENQERVARAQPPVVFISKPPPIYFAPLPSLYECITPAATDHNECGNNDAAEYAWATVDQLSDGDHALDLLFARAKSGVAFTSTENSGSKDYEQFVIVEAAESPPQEQHLAMCETHVVKGVAGPPYNCATVAIVKSNATLLRRSSGIHFCRTAKHVTMGGAIEVEFNIQTPRLPTTFSASIGKMLAEKLGLSTEQIESTTDDGKVASVVFHSTAAIRNSAILEQGWREALDLDVMISSIRRAIYVYGKVSPMVCRQASGQLVDYHGPDDAQKAKYATVLNDLVEDAIRQACRDFSKVDDKNLVCN